MSRNSRDDNGLTIDTDYNGDSGYHDEAAPSEESPLLPTDLPADIVPSKSFRRRVLLMCVVFLFIVEVGQFIMEAPLQKIMEDIICRKYYPDHPLRMPRIQDNRCKNYEVQKMLAMVRGWTFTFEMATPIIAQFPYGIIADKYGRRIVLFLAVFGCFLQTGWIIVVLQFPNTFNIWAMLPGSLFYLIGGGGAMAGAMVWTIVADVVPVAERTSVFFQLTATILLISVIVNPISAFFLKFDPWIAMWLSFGSLVVGMGSVALIPETLTFRRKADARRRHELADEEDAEREPSTESEFGWRSFRSFKTIKEQILPQVWSTVTNDMEHVWRFLFSSKNTVILILATSVFSPLRLILSNILLQYMTKRFDWEWSKATFISNAGNLATVGSLLIFLPIGSLVITKRYHYDPLHKDLILSRVSSIVAVVGLFMMAFAGVPWLFVTSLVIASLGNGFGAIARAILNAIIEPHTLATLNTTIGLCEMLFSLCSGPAMAWLLSRGMQLDGVLQGLPFFVLAFCALFVSVAVFVFRVPSGATRAHEA